ncbi:30S ribosome-binding factor RbfA [Desulfonatronovibrio hydrogenovorans]|uniref:30S ribosome-binding factor RbfA n=1 Tax=Desulfonatronovibrio hydrogenovorans TaxID=53245 RepID=UPI00048E775C|nr:30S ribosome-binding factor RbfA [Desulfonatronovibrio hydrogenovorans]
MRRSSTRRSSRMADEIMRELGRVIVRETQDPRLEFLTITGVRLNKDFSIAEILYTHYQGQSKELDQSLEKAKGFFRTALGKNLKLRYVPELRFVWDSFVQEMVYDGKP